MPALGEVFAMRNAANPEPLFCPDSSVGSGWSNSKILETAGIKNFDAVNACLNYGNGTSYDDWFLPSLAELKEVYNAYKDGKIGGTWHISSATGQVDSYWSSSEVSNANAYSLKFSDGDKWSGSRNKSYTYVRPVRAFL